MRHFIQNLIRERLPKIVESSYFNYGVKGLHCINLLEGEDFGLKLYFTETNHEMQNNLPQFYHNGITYPFKQYNRNLTVKCIKGGIALWLVNRDEYNVTFLANEYVEHYEDGLHKYDLIKPNVGLLTDKVYHLGINDYTNLKGNQLFTVGANFGVNCAWLAYEGKPIENINYQMFSNGKIGHREGLYLKPSQNDVMRVFEITGMLK